ncbi:MAG: leucine-rich repeat domain-containing protein, partial [Verrucomicrobia bacterium]|nr:leucine-rich repeat domain-containing protein [Prolixibacteraceae bacterium]
MKKQLLLLTIMLISVTMQGQGSKTVTDLSPGGLITELTSAELTSVTNLTLSGTIDARDFFQIREKITRLAVIDLTNVTVAAYTGTEGAQSGELLTFPANALPGGAFIAMANLTAVTLPATITSIGNGSFQNNGKLSFINIPSSLTSIGVNAFRNCKLLTALSIPASVVSIGANAFTESAIQVSVAAENLQYSSADGVLFNKDQSLLMYWPASKSGSYIIPSTVKNISDYAFFSCAGLTSVTIPQSVTAIGNWVFSRCSGLLSVNIPNSVTSIGECAFMDCSSLASIDIPK